MLSTHQTLRQVVFGTNMKIAADRVVLQVACGARHSLILCAKNELYAAGSNDCGQLAITDENIEYNRVGRTNCYFTSSKVKIDDTFNFHY